MGTYEYIHYNQKYSKKKPLYFFDCSIFEKGYLSRHFQVIPCFVLSSLMKFQIFNNKNNGQ